MGEGGRAERRIAVARWLTASWGRDGRPFMDALDRLSAPQRNRPFARDEILEEVPERLTTVT